MLRTGGLKAFSDGSLGSSTALFFDAYEDAPDSYGLYAEEMFPEGEMLRRILDADRAGLHVLIHAIGDRANSEVLGFFEEVARVNGPRDRRCRIEHAQHLRPQDIGRFSRAGVIASVQPYHCIADGCWAEKRIGAERCKTTYAFRSLIDAGASLALGTDWPVAPLDPLQNIMAAVTRHTLDGKHPDGWMPEQKISIEETVRAYTLGAAHAEFTDAVKGSITRGKLADLVILDRDIFTIPATEIAKAQVRMTIVDGQVAYQND
jgi:predicted amidohydrolase YtcJ